MSINMLHEDVLLDIFDFYVIERSDQKKDVEAWQTLVHVCRQWRTIVFGSPRRLNLRLHCATTTRTPVDVWPAMPLHIEGYVWSTEELDNIIALLEHNDRVYHINLADYSLYLEVILPAMQKPFPELTHLDLFSNKAVTVVPDSFLGGSVPRLRQLTLKRIPFLGLPKLLLTAPNVSYLSLSDIPHSGYISPKAIVTALSTLTSLRYLRLEFESPRSLPDGESRHLPSLTRSVLPALNTLTFKGVGEYMEDLAALIDAPQLYLLHITMFNQILFDTPQSIQFISRTTKLKAYKKACLVFKKYTAAVVLPSPPNGTGEALKVEILCTESDWQVSSLEQVCTSCLPPLSALENLYIYENSSSPPHWQDNIENTLWLELLRPFSAVKKLFLSEKFARRVGPVLEELVGSRTMEALSNLQNIFLEGLRPLGRVQEGIVKFVAARRLSGRPITVSLWERSPYDVV
jgi:hypothetical protein